jgi:Flp pilus assembly protein TadD
MNVEPRSNTASELRDATAPAPTAEEHLRRGTALLKAGNARDAEQELRAAVALDPSCAGAWVNLGGILLTRWDFLGCVDANRRAIDSRPDLAMAHFNQAIAHYYLGNAQEMVDCLSRVVELEPRNGAAFCHLGVGLQMLGRSAEARLCIQYAAELGHPPTPAAQEALRRANAESSDGAPGASDSQRSASTLKEE